MCIPFSSMNSESKWSRLQGARHKMNYNYMCIWRSLSSFILFIYFRSFRLAFNRFGSNTIALICRSTICSSIKNIFFVAPFCCGVWRKFQIDPLFSSKVIFSVAFFLYSLIHITKQAKRDQRLNNRKAEQIEININVVSSDSVVWDHLLMSRIYTNKIKKNTAMHA